MQFGITLPVAGQDVDPEHIVQVAQTAERTGLGSVWTFERLLRPAQARMLGMDQPIPLPDSYGSVFDPLETLAYLAAKTTTIRLGTSVLNALFHNPVVLAKRVATLDRLSGGRAMIGLGQGWMEQEFEAAGVPVKRRGAGFAEHVGAMRACWGADPVSFSGRFYTIPEASVGPKPSSGLSLLAGVGAPAAIERAAALGLGITAVVFDWEQAKQTVEAYGKGPGPMVFQVNGTITDRPLDQRMPLTGSTEQVSEDLARARALGVDHVIWNALDTGVDDLLGRIGELITH